MPQVKNKIILMLILFFSIFTLSTAYFIEYILKHEPCNLCIIERVPYIFSIVIIASNLIFKKFEKITFFFLGLIFIIATIISFYHFGIEQGFFKESFVCNLDNNILNLSKEDIFKELQEKTISCKNVSFTIIGLSLATINTIISVFLSVITIKLFLNYEKNK
tara:strand:+ start:1270 stop:1755 length:486 start_codon:yes stop_codon:yes gene_type:complete